MGAYRNYTIIEDEHGLAARNKAATDFNAALKTEFDEMTKQQVARAKENQKIEGQKQKAKMKASTTLNKKLTEAGLNPQDASAPSSTQAVIKQIKDQYYECAMNPSEECNETMAYLETLPKQIADGIGTQKALTQRYNEIGKIPQGQPNSLDLDRVSSDNFIFGEEFAQNNGANVVCNYDPKSKEIYWTIPGKREPILDENGEIDEDAGYIETLPARMNNKALIESQLDPNNSVDFFPTHGDPAPIVNLMHEGDKEKDLPGLGEGIEGNVLTITKEVKDDEGNVTEEKTELEGKEANEVIRKRLNAYDFTNTLNSPGAKDLYGDAVKKNVNKLEQIKTKDPETLTQTEQRIMKTWYGDNWEENMESGEADEADPIAIYQANGTAGFGPYIGDDRGQAAQSDIVQIQREVLSNGLILDYEDKFLLDEPEEEVEEEVEEEGGGEGETDLVSRTNEEGDVVDEEGNVIPQDEATTLEGTPNEETAEVVDFYSSNTDIEKPVYKNEAGEDVSFEDDSEKFLSDQEVAHGGNDNSGKATSLKEYAPGGSSHKFIKEHLESKNPVGKGTYFDGTVKKGLKTDIDEKVYNNLSDAQKAILRMEHLNVGWNPKVLMLHTAGLLPKTNGKDATITGGAKWHSKAKAKEVLDLYEKNKDKIAGLLKGKDEEMLNGLDAVYKATDNSKSNLSDDENALRKKGFEEQYGNRIRDIKDHYKIGSGGEVDVKETEDIKIDANLPKDPGITTEGTANFGTEVKEKKVNPNYTNFDKTTHKGLTEKGLKDLKNLYKNNPELNSRDAIELISYQDDPESSDMITKSALENDGYKDGEHLVWKGKLYEMKGKELIEIKVNI